MADRGLSDADDGNTVRIRGTRGGTGSPFLQGRPGAAPPGGRPTPVRDPDRRIRTRDILDAPPDNPLVPVADDPLPEVTVEGRRPGPIPGVFDSRGNQVFRVGNFVGTRDEFLARLGEEGAEQLREVGSQLEGEENAAYQRFLSECGGDAECAKSRMQKFLRVNGYSFATIRETFERLDSLFGRAVQAATDVLPEVVVRAARTPAARALMGTPLGLSTMIVEGAYRVGRELSGRALDNALRRIRPPPIPLPPPVTFTTPDVFPVPTNAPNPLPVPMDTITITAPRPGPLPRVGFDPLFATPQLRVPAPRFGRAPADRPRDQAFPRNTSAPAGGSRPSSNPRGLTFLNPTVLGFPGANLEPQPRDRCPQPDKKKRKPRPPRTVCYKGSYREKRKGLTKRRREEIPCE